MPGSATSTEHPDMTNDVLVARISGGGPERRRPRTIDLDEDRDTPDAPFSEHPLYLTYELPSNALTTSMRGDDQSVHVASPSVECAEQRPDDRAFRLGQQKNGCRVLRDSNAHTPHRRSDPYSRANLPRTERSIARRVALLV